MRRSYDGHQNKCLRGQFSSSAGIVDCGLARRPFPLELLGPILGGQYGYGSAGPAKRSLRSRVLLNFALDKVNVMQSNSQQPVGLMFKDLSAP
eukprot:1161774-Pelagomonas_calceolata.AAC.2